MRIQMKHTLLYIMSGCLGLFGCRQEESFLDNAGRVKLGVGIDDDIEIVASRSNLSEEESAALRENCKIRIFNNGKLVNRYGRWSEVPEDGILMPVGDKYSTLVIAGDSVPASFEDKYYKGTENFSVVKGQTMTVEVNCNIVNTLVKVDYSDEWSSLIDEANVTVSVEGGSLEYPMGGESKTGYFIVPYSNPVIKCVFTGKTKAGKPISHEDIIENVKEATLYTLTYAPSDSEPEPGNYGGGLFELTVDETPLYTEEETVMIYQRPVISATDGSEKIDLSSDMFISTGATMSPLFTFSGSTALKSVVVESDLLTALGFNSNSLDIIAEQQQFINEGLNVTITEDKKTVTLEFGDKLNSYFVSESSYSMKFVATDTYDETQGGRLAKTTEVLWNIVVSDANVSSVEVPADRRYEIWSDKAVFYGQNLEGKTPTETLYFRYRQKDTDTWNENIPAVTEGDYYKTAQITGLKPGTTYQYQMVEGTKVSNVISEVTTDYPEQLPNSGFEEWQGSKPMLIYSGDESNMFWDSGNHGSSSVGLVAVDLTTADGSIKHGGNYSAKLRSQFVGLGSLGAFAAGNIFVGKFIGTDGTDGILGWGRPWSTRPKSLRCYVKYEPQTAKDDNNPDRFPDGKDIGKIYIAIGDWTGASYDSSWPVVIQTKYPDTELFNPEPDSYTGDGIIAYGEKEFTQQTSAVDGGMLRVDIPIEYRYENKIPTSIIVVATASKYGDYFVGGEGSTMWLDDLELVYE